MMNYPSLRTFVSFIVSVAFSATGLCQRPNIVVIMVDDLGFSDIGCYGAEIETPNLDALAAGGLRFSQFYNTAKCHSSRVSLLSGQYCIPAGDKALTHAVTLAEVLRDGGYFTAMTGKWHLNGNPLDFGFQRYFGHLSGATNYFKGNGSFRLGRQPWKVPPRDFYTTVADVTFAIEFLNEARQTRKPWCLYVAFNAPHAPLHALQEDFDKYHGRYDAGWDAVRSARVAKQKQIGLLPVDQQESLRPEHVPAWNDLTPGQQGNEVIKMQTLAAMIDRVDQEIGRLVEDLRSAGELDNTLILFVSDNGACPYGGSSSETDVEPTSGGVSLGDSTGWAWARNSPLRYYKQNQFEGGISTPAIVHWPNGLSTKAGAIAHEPVHLIDVLPTLADVTESTIPTTYAGRDLRPVSGVSLKPILKAESLEDRPPIHLQFQNDRGLRSGDWKLVSFSGDAWELYNLAEDRAENNNLAEANPERLADMVESWTEMAVNELHLPEKFIGPPKRTQQPHTHPKWSKYSTQSAATSSTHTDTRTDLKPVGAIEPRARRNTKLEMADGVVRLIASGDDPGILIDWRDRQLPDGPYRFVMRVRAGDAADGELMYTVNPGDNPQRGKKIAFAIEGDSNAWQDIDLLIPERQRIFRLRVDPRKQPGELLISEIRLIGADGSVITSWPISRTGENRKD
ncbi:Arylsulfatase [Pirellulimonas nuda]|uniref:Arylsulfatase n=1 Tax=Pirellulimonas nuda TaxID=2528009 RepID=A0A518DCW6_9BACT|nr:arylsulfatase [Pirellulimonas nuda]QDU89309.1 Arylsulfatase [Pirellulimonas nuda]